MALGRPKEFYFFMRPNIFACYLIGFLLSGCAAEGVVTQKRSRPLPDASMIGSEGVNSFVFRGPTGTSRLPTAVPGPEFWGPERNGVYTFIIRDPQGNQRDQMVTPDVYARYRVGDYFNDQRPPPAGESYGSSDSKTSRPMIHHHRRTARSLHKKRADHVRKTDHAVARNRQRSASTHVALR